MNEEINPVESNVEQIEEKYKNSLVKMSSYLAKKISSISNTKVQIS